MVYGMKLNAYKNCIALIMQNKTVISGLIVFGFSLFIGTAAGADEVLGHISDETEPKVQQPQTAESQNSDRKIIYRVICSPDDEQLPDCEKPFHDVEADNNKPQSSQESADQANDAENPEHSEAEDNPQPVKPSLKAANKKQDKSSKKPVGKKDKQVSKSSATQKAGKKDPKKPAVKKSSVKKK